MESVLAEEAAGPPPAAAADLTDFNVDLSLSGHVASGQQPAAAAGGPGAETADVTDPFAGFADLMPHHGTGVAQGGSIEQQPAPEQQDLTQEQQETPAQHMPLGRRHSSTDGSCAAALKAAAERAAHTSDVLQQHSIEQGESNAKLR